MGDSAAAIPKEHKFSYTSAVVVPAARVVDGNVVLLEHVLTDLKFRIREVEGLNSEIVKLRLLNGAVAVPKEGPAAPAAPAAPAGDEAARIRDLEEQLRAALEENRLQKETWSAEKRVFETTVRASDPSSTVAVQAAAGGTDAVDALNYQIEQQQMDIEDLTDQVHHWQERCGSGTSNSNVLQNLLDQLQHVLRLSLDDPRRLYTAVAEAIYENTSPEQRNTIDEAPSNKADWIAYIADVLQDEQSEQSEHRDASDAVESGAVDPRARESRADEIELAERPESARAKKHNEKPGYARRAADGIQTAMNKVRGISGAKKTDMSSLLSDLKHASENAPNTDIPPT